MKTMRTNSIWYVGLAMILLLSGCFKEDINESIGQNNPEVSIYTLRSHFKGQEITLDANTLSDANYIRALVVSNHAGNNFPDNYIAVQNEWRGQLRGILLEVEDVQRYRLGDSIDFWVDGLKLAQRNGVLTLSKLSRNDIYIINRNNPVTARPVSIADLTNKFENYESTYVEVTSDLEVEPAPGEPIRGSRSVVDAKQNRAYVTVTDQATFADESVTPSATFRGIALRDNDKVQLRLLTYADMAYPSGRLYPGWPETFENPDAPKDGYANRVVLLSTGPWWFQQTLLGITAGRDRIVSGINAVRFQQNHASSDAILQMDFDVPDGASKVTFWYGSYYDDPPSWFRLEYSTDQGTTWQQIGENITDAHTNAVSLQAKQAIFMMDIQVPVRFRVNRPQANNVGGRLGLDDFAIYKSY